MLTVTGGVLLLVMAEAPFMGVVFERADAGSPCTRLHAVVAGGPAARAGLAAGDCVVPAAPNKHETACAALSKADAGAVMDFVVADGGVRSVALGRCSAANFEVRVFIHSDGKTDEKTVPRTATIREVLGAEVESSSRCQFRFHGPCTSPENQVLHALDVTKRLSEFGCYASLTVSCSDGLSEPSGDVAYMMFPNGHATPIVLGPTDRPPAELRCKRRMREKKDEPVMYDCLGVKK